MKKTKQFEKIILLALFSIILLVSFSEAKVFEECTLGHDKISRVIGKVYFVDENQGYHRAIDLYHNGFDIINSINYTRLCWKEDLPNGIFNISYQIGDTAGNWREREFSHTLSNLGEIIHSQTTFSIRDDNLVDIQNTQEVLNLDNSPKTLNTTDFFNTVISNCGCQSIIKRVSDLTYISLNKKYEIIPYVVGDLHLVPIEVAPKAISGFIAKSTYGGLVEKIDNYNKFYFESHLESGEKFKTMKVNTFMVKIPLETGFLNLKKLSLIDVYPLPDVRLDEKDYLVLIWNKPFIETDISQTYELRVEYVYNYPWNKWFMNALFGFFGALIAIIFAIIIETIFESPIKIILKNASKYINKYYVLTKIGKKKYLLPTERDVKILEKCKQLEKQKLTKEDKALVKLIKTQLEKDWRKHLLKKLDEVLRKYSK